MLMDGWQTEHFEKANELLNERHQNQKITIKEYGSTPDVLIDGRVFVDKEMFVGYALNLLQQEINATDSYDERLGIELAKNIIRNIL